MTARRGALPPSPPWLGGLVLRRLCLSDAQSRR